MPRGRPRKAKGPTIKETIIKTLVELVTILDRAPDLGSHLQWKEGIIECRHCHRSAQTAREIVHFQGSKPGDVVDGAYQVFGDPPCPMVAIEESINNAKRLLAILKEGS